MAELEELAASVRQLRVAHGELKEEVEVLKNCLLRNGSVKHHVLHRERFNEIKQNTGWVPSTSVAQVMDVLPAAARWWSWGFLGCTCRGLHETLSALVEDRVVVVGGNEGGTDLQSVEQLSLRGGGTEGTGVWEPLPPMIADRAGHASAVLGNTLYVCGGCVGGTISASVCKFSLMGRERSWTSIAPMQHRRVRAAAATVGHRVYVTGGLNDNDPFLIVNSVEQLSPGGGAPGQGAWEARPRMMEARAEHATATLQGRLVVCGGTERAGVLRSAEVFCPVEGTWRSLPPMLEPRAAHAAAVHRGILYACGGSDRTLISSVELYDPSRNAWLPGPELLRPRCFHAASMVSGHLFICGGRLGVAGDATDSVEVLSLDRWAWQDGPPMSQARASFNAVALPSSRW